jgi:adenosylcobinamide kinase/adenosylcobinamide-phosphate guanylyltransferase
MLVLVSGGARSGKSSFAEAYAAKLGRSGIYIATSQAYDEEMAARIGLHRQQREAAGFDWTTVEEPLALSDTLLQVGSRVNNRLEEDSIILVDCLTLWLSNCLLQVEAEPDAEERLTAKLDELVAACAELVKRGRHLLLVTNEVGYGLVPEYKLGRQFRDLSGKMNQKLAYEAEQVFLVTSGIPLELKSLRYRM